MVREGFKQTEVGEIPEDWDVKSIDQIASITTGGKNTQDRVDDGAYPFFVRSQTIEAINSYSFDGEAVLTAGDGVGTGKIFHYINDKFDYHQRVYNIYNFKPEVNGFYFFKYFSSRFYDRIMSMTAKSSVDSVRREMITEMKVVLPPKNEQKNIAKALSDVDNLIVSLEKLIAKKQDIKTATMQLLLTGKKRLPGFGEGKSYKQTELGEIPEDWDVKALGEVGKLKNGINKQSGDFGHGSPFVNLMDVFGVIAINSVSCLGLINSNDLEKHTYDLKTGDVIFIRSSVKPSGVGLTTVIETDLPGTVYSGFLIRFRDNGFFNRDFKKYCFHEEGFRSRIIAASTVSANTNINQDSLKAIVLCFPKDKSEQFEISKVLCSMDIEIELLLNRLEKTKLIKQGMMQELLTGRTRLVDVSAIKQNEEERMHGT